ncbi:hypothetical protein R69927_07738 [Paraburkholderia domus]|nr:hypothetical protein R69927_07738 [Paraburkholderia domus]
MLLYKQHEDVSQNAQLAAKGQMPLPEGFELSSQETIVIHRIPQPGELEPIETATRDELAALQLKRLKWSLAHAYKNVDYYRIAFDAAGVHYEDLKDLADLARFPTISKKNLRDNYPFGLFAVPKSKVVRVHASSGTTGKPTVVGYTATDIDTWANLGARSIRAACVFHAKRTAIPRQSES